MNRQQGNKAVIIFARVPRINQVKTRLNSPPLNSEAVLQLYQAFLLDIISQSTKSITDKIVLSITDSDDLISDQLSVIPFFDTILKNNSRVYSIAHVQPEKTFGERMKEAISWTRELGFDKIIVLGADSPHIQPEIINQSFFDLETTNVVLGPSPMGGIYLIGLDQHISLEGFENVFSGVELISITKWVISQKANFQLLPELTDIDTHEDLISLISILESVNLQQENVGDKKLKYQLPEHTWNTITKLGLRVINDEDDNRKKKLKAIEF